VVKQRHRTVSTPFQSLSVSHVEIIPDGMIYSLTADFERAFLRLYATGTNLFLLITSIGRAVMKMLSFDRKCLGVISQQRPAIWNWTFTRGSPHIGELASHTYLISDFLTKGPRTSIVHCWHRSQAIVVPSPQTAISAVMLPVK